MTIAYSNNYIKYEILQISMSVLDIAVVVN